MGKVATGELRNVRSFGGKFSFLVFFPASVDETGKRFLVLPIQNLSCLCRIEDRGHSTVCLADTKHRSE